MYLPQGQLLRSMACSVAAQPSLPDLGSIIEKHFPLSAPSMALFANVVKDEGKHKAKDPRQFAIDVTDDNEHGRR